MRNYSVKESKVINGKKTTITINTEDAELVRSLLTAPQADKKASAQKPKPKLKMKK